MTLVLNEYKSIQGVSGLCPTVNKILPLNNGKLDVCGGKEPSTLAWFNSSLFNVLFIVPFNTSYILFTLLRNVNLASPTETLQT